MHEEVAAFGGASSAERDRDITQLHNRTEAHQFGELPARTGRPDIKGFSSILDRTRI
jgi:hypothetical protein